MSVSQEDRDVHDWYDVRIVDGRFCYGHKNRYVGTLRSLCMERAASLIWHCYPGFEQGLSQLPGEVLALLMEHLASLSPARSLRFSAAHFLLQFGRVQDVLLERLLMRHKDLRALLAALDSALLRKVTLVNVSCKCQEPPRSSDNINLTECQRQYALDEAALAALVRDASSLQSLETTLPFDVLSLTSHLQLSRLSLRWLRTGNGPLSARLSARDLQALLLLLPTLKDLHCDVADALPLVEPEAEPLLRRLTTVFLGPSSEDALTEHLARLCPEAEDVTLHVSSSRDLQPLRRLRRLRRLAIRYTSRSSPNTFLNDSLFEALGTPVCGTLQVLELPLQARLRPQALSAACPQLRVLVARSFFRPAVRDDPQFQSLQVLQVDTLLDASVLLPVCRNTLRELRLTLSELTAADARELADLVSRCPHMDTLSVTVRSPPPGGSHNLRHAAAFLLNLVARVPNARVFC